MNIALPSTVLYLAGYLALAVGAVVAWRWGLGRSGGCIIALWVSVALILPVRFVGMLVPESAAVQPIHVLMFVSALAGTLGRHPSRVRVATLVVLLWGAGVVYASLLPPRSMHVLWSGPLAVIYFMLDLRWFGSLFR